MSQPYPDEASWWNSFRDEVLVRYARKPQDFNMDGFRWWARTAWDIGAGLEAEASKAKHLKELEDELGLTPQPIPPPAGGGIKGQLRVEGLLYRDDAGLVLPVLCHFGEAFSAFVRRPAEVLVELDKIKAAGYDGIRFWDVLGYWDVAWRNREVTPFPFINHSGVQVNATPNYYPQLESFLRELKQRGLVAQHSRGDLNSLSWNLILEHCSLVGQVQRRVGLDVIAVNEACNESWQNGVPEISRLNQMLDTIGNGAVIEATSAPDDGFGGELPDSLNEFKRDVAIIHGYRGGQSRNRIGHIHAVGYETLPAAGVPGWQGEPAGPGNGVSVGREEHPEALALMCAMALMTRQAWVYMSGNGVFWNGSITTMTGFNDVIRVKQLIPNDIMTYQKIIHGGQTWAGKRVLVANQDGTLRCDHALNDDGRFMAIVYGDPGSWQVPVEKSFEGTIINPVSGQIHPIQWAAGTTQQVDFERGRIVLGRLT